MSYDPLVESVRLIESGFEADPARLSRRRRFAAVAYDVQDDVAATWFVRRGHNTFWQEFHTLTYRDGAWIRLGGSGHNDDEDGLSDRPRAVDLPGLLVSRGGGSTTLGRSSFLPLPSACVYYAQLLVAREVTAVDISGAPRPAPRHGRLLAVWKKRPPVVRALGETGQEIAMLDLAVGRRRR
ncbi:hypothetical protein BJF78_11260 [Pseudonocardia sp. CNS-139]|nr:hypothetical protein BJF78_11260 [Pseudonocardia sp. CNS-139]